MKNYYEILEVNKKASKEIIDKAYKVLVKKYHPDLYSYSEKIYAEKKLKEINEAYRILSDDFLREQYNNELEKQEEITRKEQYEERIIENQEQPKQKKQKLNNNEHEEHNHKVGSLGSLIDLTKQLISNRPERKEKKEISQKDILAVALTIMIVLIIGVILWFIPFTNGWMRELLFENPIFNWIGGLFSN